MYDYSTLIVARNEEERRRQQAEIISTVYGGYAPMKQGRMRRWMAMRIQSLRGREITPVRSDPQMPFTRPEIDAANMAGD